MRTKRDREGGRLQIPRSRGAASGFLLIVLGVFGALIPFVGPYFDFAFSPDTPWAWSSAGSAVASRRLSSSPARIGRRQVGQVRSRARVVVPVGPRMPWLMRWWRWQ